MTVKAIPDDHHRITPYLVVPGVARLLDFLKRAFDATETKSPMTRADGSVMHAEVRIGDCRVMMGEPMGDFTPMPAMLYLYVEDVDAAYRRALDAGAKAVMEPADQFYGDRNGGVQDPSGNLWWLAARKEDLTDEEVQQRARSYAAEKKSA